MAVEAGGYQKVSDVDGRGLANVDVTPHGPERYAVVSGQRKMLDFEDGYYYPAQTGIDFYHHYKEDIALFAEMGFKTIRMSLAWTRIFPNGTRPIPTRTAWTFWSTPPGARSTSSLSAPARCQSATALSTSTRRRG